jgi:hypothetical protein
MKSTASKLSVVQSINHLRPLSSESSSELKILRLDSYSLGVDSGEIGYLSVSVTSCRKIELTVFKERDEVCLGSFLKSSNGARLESATLSALNIFPMWRAYRSVLKS